MTSLTLGRVSEAFTEARDTRAAVAAGHTRLVASMILGLSAARETIPYADARGAPLRSRRAMNLVPDIVVQQPIPLVDGPRDAIVETVAAGVLAAADVPVAPHVEHGDVEEGVPAGKTA